jgi:hypothetical protein
VTEKKGLSGAAKSALIGKGVGAVTIADYYQEKRSGGAVIGGLAG